MLSLTSRRAERTSGPEKFRRSVKEDFFNTLGQKRTSAQATADVRFRLHNGPGCGRWRRPLSAPKAEVASMTSSRIRNDSGIAGPGALLADNRMPSTSPDGNA